MAEEQVPSTNSVFWFGSWVTVALIGLSIFFDVAGEKLTDFLKRTARKESAEEAIKAEFSRRRRANSQGTGVRRPAASAEQKAKEKAKEEETKLEVEAAAAEAAAAAEEEEEEEDEYTVRGPGETFLSMWQRLSAELTTLGFLAFTCYIFSEAGFYPWVVELTVDRQKEGEAPTEGELRIRRLMQRFLEGEEGEVEGDHGELSDSCKRYLNSEADWLKEHVECVHMSIFIAMLLYFTIVTIALIVHNARFSRPSADEHDSTALANPRFVHRRAWLLKAVRTWPAVQVAAQSDTAVARALNEGRFDFYKYVHISSAAAADRLIEFPPSTWAIALVYFVLWATLSDHACVEEHWIRLGALLVAMAVFLYLSLRIALFHLLLKRGANPWPTPAFDRFVGVAVGPCCMGYVPWRAAPNRDLALSVQQAWLFSLLLHSAYILTNEHGAMLQGSTGQAYNAQLVSLMIVGAGSLLMALVVWPLAIELYGLPPFATAENTQHRFVALLRAEAKGGDGGAAQGGGRMTSRTPDSASEDSGLGPTAMIAC